ncbi:uncharacterized protein C8A04DRAFT_31781 [Dichotomopilus funicola]|uniref:Uncharacterized protein n=1 Tax=Dichotomopilus funicola TaxID=1934379 RepID=A0AAN6ZKH2_9PEZI|nr:hypothetical protein C8A04DRAFT_31781 [Dichotomopilus funicola]
MSPIPPPPTGLVYGWVSSADIRGTRDILVSSLSTIWLCTWTSLCLNIPPQHIRAHRIRWLFNKFKWQLFAIFFPEVLVATAAEQWLSARQSARAFARLGYPEWTIRHAFFADMGGIVVAPPDVPPFPVDSQQLAYLVANKHLALPSLSTEDIRSMNKADGLARVVTMAQMAWFCLSCAARGASGLGFCTLEVTTLAYILCTAHTFFFWYYKPLDPEAQRTFVMHTSMADIRDRDADAAGKASKLPPSYMHTPLDFIKPPPDPKSLIAPFWFGLDATFRPFPPKGRRRWWRWKTPGGGPQVVPVEKKKQTAPPIAPGITPVKTLANSRVLPEEGISTALMLYTLLFQVAYFGLHIGFAWVTFFPSQTEWLLWIVSTAVDFGLIVLYLLAIPVGTHLAPYLGRLLFDMEATHLLEVAHALPPWAKLVIHAPFVLGYVVARMAVLVESVMSLRVVPESVYRDVNWTSFLPHV